MSLLEKLSGAVMSQMSQQAAQKTGLQSDMVEGMMPAILGAVVGGLNKNAQSSGGANALNQALEKHDGSVLENLSQLGNADILSDGQNILGHILGSKKELATETLAKQAGISSMQASDLLAMAAPAVLGALGKTKRENNLGATDLSQLLSAERSQIEQQASSQLGGLMGLIDQDGDGDIKNDLVRSVGKKLLGGLFGKK